MKISPTTPIHHISQGTLGARHSTLFDVMKDNGLVLFFYPKDNTPGCSLQTRGYAADLHEFSARGFGVAGVSMGNPKSAQKMHDTCATDGLALIMDDGTLANALGAIGQKSMFGKSYTGIFRHTFILNTEGQVIWQNQKVKTASDAKDTLAQIDALSNQENK